MVYQNQARFLLFMCAFFMSVSLSLARLSRGALLAGALAR